LTDSDSIAMEDDVKKEEDFKVEEERKKKDEPVYEDASKLIQKAAVQRINDKYDSLGRLRSQTDLEEETELEVVPITDHDLMQIEMFFQSHKTSVFVCPSLVNAYIAGPLTSGEPPSWELKYTGLLVLLLDRGETRARTRRQIRLVVAERGTGFMLWEDVIDNLSNYSAPNPTFHNMYLSVDHTRMVGFSFDDPVAAGELLARIEVLTSDPANIALSGPSSKSKKKKKKCKPEKTRLPRKADISLPCCFQHVTRVDIGDKPHLFSLSTMTRDAKQ